MFLGDGRQDFGTDGDAILDLISEKNAKLNNSVLVVTYGVGEGMSTQ